MVPIFAAVAVVSAVPLGPFLRNLDRRVEQSVRNGLNGSRAADGGSCSSAAEVGHPTRTSGPSKRR